ncbi:MAG: two-component system response regulator BtsR [Terriglobales bacterium]
MIRGLIIDDELHAREELAALLAETGEFEVVRSCSNAVEALREIRAEAPDVLFLDIHMPAVSGFELLSMIDPEIMPHVVFVTAYDAYAVKAFEENALDYLVKPVEKHRLAKTVRKLKESDGKGNHPVYATPEIRNIPCVMTNRIKLIGISEVEYVRSDMAGVYVVCPKGQFFTELTLKVLENKTNLLRAHKQYLVNLDQVDEILVHDNLLAEIKMKSGATVPVSRRFFKKLKERLGI